MSIAESPSPTPGARLPSVIATFPDGEHGPLHHHQTPVAHGSLAVTPLLCSSPSLLAEDVDSPPDSPAMPWRPGSSAYPPPAPIYPPSAPSNDQCDRDDSNSCRIRQSKQELQQLYNSLCEASYDLSLRDIVEPPFSIHGTVHPTVLPNSIVPTEAEKETAFSEILPYVSRDRPCLNQERSQSCRKSNKYETPSSPECKLAFSFSFPRSTSTLHSINGLSTSRSKQKMQLPNQTPENALRRAPLPRLAHVLSMPHELMPSSPASKASGGGSLPLSEFSSRPSFKRSHSGAHHRPSAPEFKNHSEFSRKEHKCRGTFSGSSNRVHPSNQCSACAAYTIFFKSRCMVCGKLYCSNCARDAMDVVSDGRKCKGDCNARLRRKRLPKSLRSKCWPLCGNVEISKDPIPCKTVC